MRNQAASVTLPKAVRNTTRAKTVNRAKSTQRNARKTANSRLDDIENQDELSSMFD